MLLLLLFEIRDALVLLPSAPLQFRVAENVRDQAAMTVGKQVLRRRQVHLQLSSERRYLRHEVVRDDPELSQQDST